ncbi:deoxyribose-phosphate aldolase [Halapricum hydrolyticum]|uniref:Deoxyribose-phosphate aldolase n=1 Tax=Halapricum hydrolyticum TaxID=2979991 RepID=A0AAE3IBW5_9EURY|nr:deoxyribose-phosphate aldolase [Halapricum hydrolyticum]MCU4718673.1 deoxyribose-phosphate aldolase [Halapricum hydrolyticum]MCU4727641.1 deoxyribose-phosphate aldolase [Halapricum hydrolyticum]
MDDIAARIEHTVLGPTTTPADVRAVLDVAIETGMRACVPPCYVSMAAEYASSVAVTTVVGFPHGQHTSAIKTEEAAALVEAGADELDMVANLGLLRAGEDETFRWDIAEVVAATTRPVKVIVEAPLLADDEKHRAARLAAEADAAYLKTATGFADGGATTDDVELLSTYLPVKAAGGIDTWERAEKLFEAGAERIGASSGETILEKYRRSKT